MEQGRDAWNQLFLLVRSEVTPRLVSPVRAAVASIDPEQPVYMIQTLEEAVAMSSFQQRVAAMLLGIFAAVALVLAGVGIYGVMSHRSARGRRRSASGWRSGRATDVLRLVLMQVGQLAVIGLAIGTGLLLLRRQGAARPAVRCPPIDAMTIVAVTADPRCGRPHRGLGPRPARQPRESDRRLSLRVNLGLRPAPRNEHNSV